MPLGRRGAYDTMEPPLCLRQLSTRLRSPGFVRRVLSRAGVCTLFLQYHWPFSLSALHFSHHAVLSPASTGQTVNDSDELQARVMSSLPSILHDPSHPSLLSNTFSHGSNTEDWSSVPSTATLPRSRSKNWQENSMDL